MIERVYLSVSLQRADDASWVEHALRARGIEVANPCRLDFPPVPKERFPAAVAEACYRLIDAADAVVLLADYYGRDCAAEIGYAHALGRPVVALRRPGGGADHLTEDWMVRAVVATVASDLAELVVALDELDPAAEVTTAGVGP